MDLVPEVMISPKTLNSWLTGGYGVDTFGYNRIVILDVDDTDGYHQGHIPGAYLLEESSADLWATRSNGISDTSCQVATQIQMDEIIRRTNIDNDSIIILTGSRMTGVGRAYFNFRYWGFPRQQLKVLNGTNTTYTAAGFLLEKVVPPVPEPCRFSVCSTTGLSSFSTVRASYEEMIAVAADNESETIIIDSRSPEKYAGKPGSTLIDKSGNSYVAFEGHIRTAANIDYKTVLVDQGLENPLLPPENIEKVLNKNNLDKNKKYFVYGTNAFDDSVLFLALDAVLNWPVKLYDGGWQQWGQMAGNSTAKGGMLDEDSAWRADNATRSESITYNKSSGFVVETGGVYDSYAQNGNAISRHDLEVCGKSATDLKTAPIAPGY